MKRHTWRALLLVCGLMSLLLLTRLDHGPVRRAAATQGAPTEATLPPGVKAVWDVSKAHRDRTPTRERVCLNGLWRWQPAREGTDNVPADRWGYFNVPGFWPGYTSCVKETTALNKLKPMLAEGKGNVAAKLAGQGTGEFYLLRGKEVYGLKTELSLIPTAQLPEQKIADLARSGRPK